MNTTAFEQINVSLPPEHIRWLRTQAAREDRTLSGLVRRLVAEAARQALPTPPPPSPSPPPQKVLEPVLATRAGILEGKARLATLRERRQALVQNERLGVHMPTDNQELREIM